MLCIGSRDEGAVPFGCHDNGRVETCRAIGYKNVVCQPWILYAYCVATVAKLWFNADALAFEITFFLAVFAAMTAGIVSKKIRGAVGCRRWAFLRIR